MTNYDVYKSLRIMYQLRVVFTGISGVVVHADVHTELRSTV